MHNNEQAVHEMRRGECYRFLAACFYQPKKEVLGAERLLPNLELNLQEVCPAAVIFARRMQESLAACTEEELAVEHARLFVGPFGLKAPPYGSVYLDGDHTVMGASTLETISLYEQEGLARDESFNELPDHIAVELEFLYYLIYCQVEALGKNDLERFQEYKRKEVSFVSRYLGKWAPRLCSSMKEETEHVFYRSLADCLMTLFEAERER